MPVNNLHQAVLQLSSKQLITLGQLGEELGKYGIPAATLEEVNVTGALVVKTKRGTSIVDSNGAIAKLEKRGA
jgi:hypothetical protein